MVSTRLTCYDATTRKESNVTLILELWNWLRSLDSSFTFLLALPFVVAAASLLREWIRPTS
jgi:hypothetical protein